MIKNLIALFICGVFGANLIGEVVPMASQPWVKKHVDQSISAIRESVENAANIASEATVKAEGAQNLAQGAIMESRNASAQAVDAQTKADSAKTASTNAVHVAKQAEDTATNALAKVSSLDSRVWNQIEIMNQTDLSLAGEITKTKNDLAIEVTQRADGDDATLKESKDYTDAAVAGCFPLSEGNSLWAYLTGENFRVTVTNYDSMVHSPRVSFEYRMATNEDWRIVWREQTGLDNCINVATNVAIAAARELDADPVNRAWGKYNSETGEASAPGFVQVSSTGGLLIGSEVAFTQIEGTQGFWVLCSTAESGLATTTNGEFRIYSSDGDIALAIRMGNMQTLPANVSWVSSLGPGYMLVNYKIISEKHPTMMCSEVIEGGFNWVEEGAEGNPFQVAWSGESGNWLATITTQPATQGFFQAVYKTGGETVIEAKKPFSANKLVIGGVTYTVGTALVNDQRVLTLTIAN